MNSNPLFILRPMTSKDTQQVMSLCWQLGYDNNLPAFQQRLNLLLEEREHLLLVAQDALGDLKGCMHVRMLLSLEREPCAEIGMLIVDEASRGHGVGSALIRAAEVWAKQKHLPTLYLYSREERTQAHKFYEDQGFTCLKVSHVYSKKV